MFSVGLRTRLSLLTAVDSTLILNLTLNKPKSWQNTFRRAGFQVCRCSRAVSWKSLANKENFIGNFLFGNGGSFVSQVTHEVKRSRWRSKGDFGVTHDPMLRWSAVFECACVRGLECARVCAYVRVHAWTSVCV